MKVYRKDAERGRERLLGRCLRPCLPLGPEEVSRSCSGLAGARNFQSLRFLLPPVRALIMWRLMSSVTPAIRAVGQGGSPGTPTSMRERLHGADSSVGSDSRRWFGGRQAREHGIQSQTQAGLHDLILPHTSWVSSGAFLPLFLISKTESGSWGGYHRCQVASCELIKEPLLCLLLPSAG